MPPTRGPKANSLRVAGPVCVSGRNRLNAVVKRARLAGPVELAFDKQTGLIPAIAQDHLTGAIRMVAYMNREALVETQRTGNATFYSRSRQRLWVKGESSGHTLRVVR